MISVNKIFSDFVAISDISDIVDIKKIKNEMFEYIEKYDSNGRKFSNSGGYQSNDINKEIIELNTNYSAFHSLYATIELYCSSIIHSQLKVTNSWININKTNDYNTTHCHPYSVISGILYLESPENSGDLVFQRERSFLDYDLSSHFKLIDDPQVKSENYYVTPKEGHLIMFPSNLLHFVENNKSSKDRISFAFNTLR